jgi:hypothetical protein
MPDFSAFRKQLRPTRKGSNILNMKVNSLRPVLMSSSLMALTLIAGPVLAKSARDMTAVFSQAPVQSGTTGKKPAVVVPVSTSQTKSATKILMIDTTLMAIGDCPNVLVGLIKSTRSNGEVKLTEVVGEDYAFHNHLLDGSAAKAMEKSGPWDFVLLQPHSKELIYNTAETIRDGQLLATMAIGHQSQVNVLDTWSSNDPVANQLMERGNQVLANNLHAQRIPICTALFQARNIPNIRLFRQDNHHLAPDGVYLAACVIYAKLMRRSPVGLPAKVYQGSRLMCEVSPEVAKQIQTLAANFVK